MNLRFGIASVFSAICVVVPSLAGAQPAASPSPPSQPSAILQSALAEIQGSTSALNIGKWKAPGRVRDDAEQNVSSIQRDISVSLPGLLAQADAAPGSVSPSFAVYRNIDALYDVLLRVSETADLSAPSNEAASLASCLQSLETARAGLADAILRNSQHNEAQLTALEASVRREKATPAKASRATVVDDGEVKAPVKHTRKAKPKKPANTASNPPK
ncbi:MAG TPA: hypothetical protein VFW25_13750 [Silvibacterium sp.]|nr:hypothetical protein [Silvibacterium sp.]